MGNRKEAVALARQGETLRLMGINGQDVQNSKKFFDKAASAFENATKADDTYAWAWAHWGLTLSYQGGILNKSDSCKEKMYELAEAKFQEAIKRNNQYAWALAHMGQNYCWWAINLIEHGQQGTGLEYLETKAIDNSFRTAITIDPKYAWAYAKMAVAFRILALLNAEDTKETQDNYDNAVKLLEEAIKQNQEYSWAHAYLAVIHRQKARAYSYVSKQVTDPKHKLTLMENQSAEWEKVYANIEEAVKIYPAVFGPPKMLDIGFLNPEPVRNPPSISEPFENPSEKDDKYTLYAKAVSKVYREGYLAAEADIDKVLAIFANRGL